MQNYRTNRDHFRQGDKENKDKETDSEHKLINRIIEQPP